MYADVAKRLVSGLKAAGIDFVTFLPESRLSDIVPLLHEDPWFTVIRASHEGSAANIASGAALVGRKPALYMEATGFMLSLYNLQCVALNSQIPLLLLVAYIGSPGDAANRATFSGFGRRLEPLLDAMGIQFEVLDDGHELERKVADMARAAQAAKQPACLLFTGDFTRFDGEWA